MTLNEKFLAAVAKHIPAINLTSLRRRLAPIDIDARYTAACLTEADMRDFGTAEQLAIANRHLDEVSEERMALLNARK